MQDPLVLGRRHHLDPGRYRSKKAFGAAAFGQNRLIQRQRLAHEALKGCGGVHLKTSAALDVFQRLGARAWRRTLRTD